ncbi:MAG: SGNH/GDSL hydrolase family protein [Blautia sp.]|nr:SGNH/GDSL hydrolase family protein [Blautia sp.]
MEKHLRRCSAALILMAAIMLSMWLPGTSATVKAATLNKPGFVGSAVNKVVTLKWTYPSKAAGVELYGYRNGGYKLIKTFWKSRNVKQISLTGDYGGSYWFRIRGFYKQNGKNVYGSYATVVVKTAPQRTYITNTKREQLSSGIVVWAKNAKADGYEIYRSSAKNGTYAKVATITSGNISAVRDKTLKSSGTYYYKVRAYSKNMYSKAYGSFGTAEQLSKYTAPSVQTNTNRKLLIVGDSRVDYMSSWCSNAKVSYIAKSNTGISWLSSASVQNQILASLDGKTDIAVWIGTNDYDYIYNKYVPYYASIIPAWKSRGANVYLVGLGQFLGGADGYGGSNSDLVRFNTGLKSVAAATGAKFVDLYSYLSGTGFSYLSGDRVHFSQATTQVVFRYLLSVAGIN